MLMAMSAVPFPVTERQIDDRRRLGIDKRDECWAGEWHLVNPPKRWHAELGSDLFLLLAPRAKARGLRAVQEAGGVFGAADDWRVPDQVHARPEDGRDDGYVSAELVVEIRSPGDDSYRKLGFYAARGIGEVLILHEDRRVELFRLDGDGVLIRVSPGDDGGVCCEALGVTFTTVAGPRLRVAWDGGCAEV
jgi:Uma2 family endonuclease